MRSSRPWIVALLAGTLTASSVHAASEQPLTSTRTASVSQDKLYDALLDALYATFGKHSGFRATHAKGVLVNGFFTASPAAATLSRAAHLQGQPVPVVLRFSNFSGVPATVDGDPMASPRGLAVRFRLPNGEVTDIVSHSFDGFPVATPEDFLVFLQGIAATVSTPPDPQPLQAFLAEHSRARHFLETAKPAPSSYTRLEYFGVNSLVFSNRENQEHIVRYRIEPLTGQSLISDQQAARMPVDYLQDELTARLAKGPAQMRLIAQLAEPGDVVEDGSIPWPRNRREVELGLFTLDSVVPDEDQQSLQQRLDFSPGRLPDGIALSRDPMTLARDRIYQRAALRRQ
ncbi:catalase family peroxidase [Pseudomonas sp. BW7P1]|uniref:catalase family peroxidase n=1 Tax=Pseudomonas TaxID=286 RepID=UPI0021AE15CE|nr:catalase family peroxidase [Pseudomonas sp. BW7P1]UWI64145.1 catalase family peroxidase [Pseudomonas sp. BW7P1]